MTNELFGNNFEILLVRRSYGRSNVIGRIFGQHKRVFRNGTIVIWYLLKPVMIGGIFMDHVWVRTDKCMLKVSAFMGQTISFTARIGVYKRTKNDPWDNEKFGIRPPYKDIRIIQ